jgi:hypothetical protein
MISNRSSNMPVRQAPSYRMNVSRGDSSTFEVAGEPPSMPVRQASRRRVTAAPPVTDFSRRPKPPSMPVRQLSKPRGLSANTFKVSALSPMRPERHDSMQKSTSTTMAMAQVAELSKRQVAELSQIAELEKPCYYFS